MRPEFIVAEKEFRDHLASKRFLAIFVILLLLSLYGAYTGLQSYQQQLNQYKNPQAISDPTTKSMVESLQEQINDAGARGDSPQDIQSLKDELNSLTQVPMPSILIIFRGIVLYFTIVGMFLGAVMGFDRISAEKEEGSIKFLAISPLYRDAIINGKTIGAIATLAVALAASILLIIAIAIFQGVIPGFDDLLRIGLFFLVALVYCTVFFGIAMMLSVIVKTTSLAAICTGGAIILIIGYTVMSLVIASFVAASAAGTPPPGYYDAMTNTTNVSGLLENKAFMNYTMNEEMSLIQTEDTLTTIMPTSDFGGLAGLGPGGIAYSILSTEGNSLSMNVGKPVTQVSLLDSLASVWVKILIFLVYLIVPFAISYVVFMRLDIR